MLVVPDSLGLVDTEPQKLELSSFIDVDDLPLQYILTFQSLAVVPRYIDEDLPKGFITDNVADHTLRCMSRLDGLFRPRKATSEMKSAPVMICERMLFIHDFGEVGVGDNNAVKGKKTEEDKDREREAAKSVLSEGDFKLFSLFEAASDFLNGVAGARVGQSPVDRAGVLAKLIDSIDGNVVFHRALNIWINNGNGMEGILVSYINWMFSQHAKYKSQIEKLNIPDVEKAFFIELLDTQLLEVQNM